MVTVTEKVHFFEFEFNGGYGWAKEYVFGAQVGLGVEVVLSDEHSEMRWCNLEEALRLLAYESNRVGFRRVGELVG